MNSDRNMRRAQKDYHQENIETLVREFGEKRRIEITLEYQNEREWWEQHGRSRDRNYLHIFAILSTEERCRQKYRDETA